MTRNAEFILMLPMILAGCGKTPVPLPMTYPVAGKVTYKDGTPVTAGLVQFYPEKDRSVTSTAAIRQDGTYRLTTMRDGLRAEGAVAGPNRVMVSVAIDSTVAPQGRAMPGGLPPTFYPTPYNVEPRGNEFNLRIERAHH